MKIKVVTFNLRMNTHRDGINYFFNRAPLILKRIREEKPDIIGFQEATQPILEWLKATLTEYTLVGIVRSKDFKSEANPIAFRKDRFDLFSFQQFWLSPTPEVPGTRYEEQSDCPRVCCAVKLREIGTTEVVRFYNTHLDNVDAEARLLGIRQIRVQIKEDYEKSPHPLILTGDMNASPEEISMLEVTAFANPKLVDAAGRVVRSFHGYHGGSPYEGSIDRKIDYIFTNVLEDAIECDVWDGVYNGMYLSDHYPIMAELHL